MSKRLVRDWTDSQRVNLLSNNAEIFFLRLIMKADDYGTFHAAPKLLKSFCYPLKDTIRDTDITRWLAECEKAGLLHCFEASGQRYLSIFRFGQKLREMIRRFPKPPDTPPDKNNNSFSSLPSQDGIGDARGKGKLDASSRVVFSKEYDRVLKRMAAIRDSYGDHQTRSKEDHAEFAALLARQHELKEILGVKV